MDVLIDTSVWIDYFRGNESVSHLDFLIEENLILTNDLILAELIPYLEIKKQFEVIELLGIVRRIPLSVHWEEIIDFQVKCMRNGANGIGIPDLIIAQNALQNHCRIYSRDKHFQLLSRTLGISLYGGDP